MVKSDVEKNGLRRMEGVVPVRGKRIIFGSGIQRWRSSTLVLLFALAFLICCIVYAILPDGDYTIYVPMRAERGEIQINFGQEGVVEMENVRPEHDYMRFEMRPMEEGVSEVAFTMPRNDVPFYTTEVQVDRLGNVYDKSSGNYKGYEWVLLALTVFVIAAAGSLFIEFMALVRRDLYDYRAVFLVGLGIFLLSVGIILGIEWVRLVRAPAKVTRRDVLLALSNSGSDYMRFTLPFLVAFSVAMTISNLVLLKKEGRRIKNLLGMILGVMMLLGEWFGSILSQPSGGSAFWQRLIRVFVSVYTSGFVYLECMLIGTICCAVLAVRHVPDRDKDFLVILGCGFAKDGTLYPLLRGRVDKAIAFWRMQQKQTGKRAIFVPSGGQGKDEPMAEAEAMKRYLLTQGFTQKDILIENKSANTFENMLFSKAVIEKRKRHPKSIFVTTNYHLFRSGILARKVGFEADGLGSHTKWYFWPNAFVREFLGLMHAQFGRQTGVLAAMVLTYALIAFCVT